MNLYYELSGDNLSFSADKAGGKYWVQYNVRAWNGVASTRSYQRSAMELANRVWIEDETGIRYFKNRMMDLNTKCDMEEFMWIKLKCREL